MQNKTNREAIWRSLNFKRPNIIRKISGCNHGSYWFVYCWTPLSCSWLQLTALSLLLEVNSSSITPPQFSKSGLAVVFSVSKFVFKWLIPPTAPGKIRFYFWHLRMIYTTMLIWRFNPKYSRKSVVANPRTLFCFKVFGATENYLHSKELFRVLVFRVLFRVSESVASLVNILPALLEEFVWIAK